jgi:beta-lactamase regulating signal transducer with metallopeptidase domain
LKALETILTQPITQAVGWALVHSLWQGTLVALVFGSLSALLKESAANVRYVAGCSALALMLVLPLATACVMTRSFHAAAREEVSAAAAAGDAAQLRAGLREEERLPASNLTDEAESTGANVSTDLLTWAQGRLTTLVPWFVLVWLSGVSLLLLRLAGGWAAVRRLRRSARPAAAQCEEILARLCERLRVSRTIKLCESLLVEVPTVIGWLRPVVLVPASALIGLSPRQLEALLAHELAHVRRHDYLFNLLQTTIETLLFYHPAVWWVSRRIRVEREHACDDIAVAATGDVLAYARALAGLEQLRQTRGDHAASLALAANGGSLMQRIQRLIKTDHAPRPRRSLAAGAALVVLLCAVAVSAHMLVATDRGDTSAAGAPAVAAPARREVAVTFVNFPGNLSDTGRMTNKTRKLLRSLAANKIEAVAFVNEGRLYKEDGTPDEARVRLLAEWLDAGHELGNETFNHTGLSRASLEEFQADVVRGEKIMGGLVRERGKHLRYFSYPYLNTGANLEEKSAAEKFLRGRGYQTHPVTIDNMDWLFSQAYTEALRREDTVATERIRAEYVGYMERMFEFFEEYSREVVGREFPQVLMLTAGALNADSFDDLASMLRRRGYAFVTMEQATKDEAYRQPDNYAGKRGDSWIARWAVTKGKEYKDIEEELPPLMQQYFEEFLKKQRANKMKGGDAKK